MIFFPKKSSSTPTTVQFPIWTMGGKNQQKFFLSGLNHCLGQNQRFEAAKPIVFKRARCLCQCRQCSSCQCFKTLPQRALKKLRDKLFKNRSSINRHLKKYWLNEYFKISIFCVSVFLRRNLPKQNVFISILSAVFIRPKFIPHYLLKD